MSKISREDIPSQIVNLISVVVDVGMYDAIEIYCDAVNFGNNWKALAEEISMVSASCRHYNQEGCRRVSVAIDTVFKELNL